MTTDPKPTDGEILDWIFTHNATVLEQSSGSFACLYQAPGGRGQWGPQARSKRDAVWAAMGQPARHVADCSTWQNLKTGSLD